MIVVGILVSLVLLVVISRIALSKKTDKPVKRAAIIALSAIGLASAICTIAVAAGPKAVEDDPIFAGLSLEGPVRAANPYTVYALIFGILMVLVIGLIIFLSLRKREK
jgi:hypothetical protein